MKEEAIKQELYSLEKNLKIPIDNIEYKEDHAELILKEKVIGKIGYIKNDTKIIFDYSSESPPEIDWGLIVQMEVENIKASANIYAKGQDILIVPKGFGLINVLDSERNLLFSAEIVYHFRKWKLIQDTSHEISKRDNEIQVLKNKLSNNGQYNSQNNNYLDHQSRIIEKVLDKGGDFFTIWMQAQSQNEGQEQKLINEFEKQELEVVRELDKRDKFYKGGIVLLCLIVMGILAYFEKASPVLPLIGVIIGLILQSDSITRYFTGSAKKKNSKYLSEED